MTKIYETLKKKNLKTSNKPLTKSTKSLLFGAENQEKYWSTRAATIDNFDGRLINQLLKQLIN